ncbi:hypothetical protein ACFE04_007127 [Oxalis oulophora]
MASAWILNGRAIAQIITGGPSSQTLKGPTLECPTCLYQIDNGCNIWPGLPVGCKFEPTDAELLQHLAVKCGFGDTQPNVFLDLFILTLEAELGINCAHPEYLPGTKRDGSSMHFFHRITNAYASGQRKRRKIDCQSEDNFRWHKTGKTKPIMVNAALMGWKKIMVLYTTSKKGRPVKGNWVLHQLHLGAEEDEQQGEYVVSRIMYKCEESLLSEDLDKTTPRTPSACTIPRTPSAYTPDPPRPGSLLVDDYVVDNYQAESFPGLEEELTSYGAEDVIGIDEGLEFSAAWLAGESQPPESLDLLNCTDISSMCNSPFSNTKSQRSDKTIKLTGLACNPSQMTGSKARSDCISELVNIETESPPDFNLHDLQIISQDSYFDGINMTNAGELDSYLKCASSDKMLCHDPDGYMSAI